MNKTSLVITLAFGGAIGFLVARLASPAEAPAPAKVATPVAIAPVVAPEPKPAPVVATQPVAAPPAKAKAPAMDEATKARYKAFGEETRKMAMDLAGGDEKKLGQAFRSMMFDPEAQKLFNRGREIGEAFRNAQNDGEREALEVEVQALRDKSMVMIKEELDRMDAKAPAPAAAPAAPVEAPTPGLM